jgi:hypothetical protein
MPAITSLIRGTIRAEHAHVHELHAGGDPADEEAGDALPAPWVAAFPDFHCVPWPNASATDGSPVIRLTFATHPVDDAACGECRSTI